MGQYTVQAGDLLFNIVQKLNICLAALEAANPGLEPQNLQVGQVINIPDGSGGSTQSGPTTYTIQPGDTFFAIAKKFNVSLQDLQNANPSVDENAIPVGSVINIP